jgi:hypothetical protein
MQDLMRIRGPALLGCSLLACDVTDTPPGTLSSDAGEREPRTKESGMTAAPAAVEVRDAAADDLFPSNWCTRAGATGGEQDDAMLNIGLDYLAAQKGDCRVRGLTESMTPEQDLDWGNYLIAYTYVMVGCPYLIAVPGGILAFGPANTPAIGVARPLLGRDDVAALVGPYLDLFSERLRLSGRQRDSVEAHLLATAQPVIDPRVSGGLSRCGDAGADGGT